MNKIKILRRIIPLLIALLISSTHTESNAQGLDLVISQESGCEDTRCCMVFTLVIPDGVTVKNLYVQLWGQYASSDACFDWDCFEAQGGAQFSHQGLGTFNVIFGGNGLTGPTSFSFKLCSSGPTIGPLCDGVFTEYTYGCTDAQNNLVMNGTKIPIQGGGCGSSGDECGGCDKFWMAFRYKCAIKFCFQRRGNSSINPTCSLRVTFSPPLDPCIDDGPADGCDWWTANGITTDAGGWDIAPHYNGAGKINYIDFTAVSQGACIGHCHTFCFRIPKCFADQNTTVKIYDLDDDQTCGTQELVLKQSPILPVPHHDDNTVIDTRSMILSKDNNYVGTIPVTLSFDGSARLILYYSMLDEVYRIENEFLSKKQGTFIIDGSKFPSGSYFYSIEAPIGVMQIVKQTIIIK